MPSAQLFTIIPAHYVEAALMTQGIFSAVPPIDDAAFQGPSLVEGEDELRSTLVMLLPHKVFMLTLAITMWRQPS